MTIQYSDLRLVERLLADGRTGTVLVEQVTMQDGKVEPKESNGIIQSVLQSAHY